MSQKKKKKTVSLHTKRSFSGQLFSEFQSSIGISASAGGSQDFDDTERWEFKNLRTIYFEPTTEYVQQALMDLDVQKYMDRGKTWLDGKKIYMVTGVKIAYGATSAISYLKERGFQLKIGFDMTSLGIPMTFGPDGEFHKNIGVSTTAEGADPFVFAFRIRRIKVSLAGDVKIDRQDWRKGTVLGIDGTKAHATPELPELLVEDVEDFDADGAEFGFEIRESEEEDVFFPGSLCRYSKAS